MTSAMPPSRSERQAPPGSGGSGARGGVGRPGDAGPRGHESVGRRIATSLWLVAAPLTVLLVAVLFLLVSGGITGREGAYPRVLAGIVVVMALAAVLGDLRDGRRALAPGSPLPSAETVPDDHVERDADLEGGRGRGLAVRRVLVFAAVAVLSVFLMSYLGFFLPGVLLLAGGLLALGVRTPWKVVAYTAGLLGAAYALFVEALKVPFPPAPWS